MADRKMCRPLTLPPEIMPVYQKASILRKHSSLLMVPSSFPIPSIALNDFGEKADRVSAFRSAEPISPENLT